MMILRRTLTYCLLISGSLSLAADWPKWLGPNGNNIANETLPEAPVLDNLIWKLDIGVGYSSFAVAGDRVLTSGHNGGTETVYCLNVATGKVNWTHNYPAKKLARLHKGGPSSSPVIDGDQVYAISKDGLMHCLSLADGSVVWQLDLKKAGGIDEPAEWGYAGSSLIVGDNVIAESGRTFALNKATGEIVWQSQDFRPSYGSPTLFEADGKSLLAVLKTDGLAILDASSGKTLGFEKWETSFATNATTPIVVGNQIFISTGYKRGCALFAWENGTLNKVYENKHMSNHMNNSVLVNGVICGFDGNAHMGKPTEFVGIDWASGREVFRVSKSEGLGCGSVIADAGGKLIILTERGELATANVTDSSFTLEDRAQIIGGRCWTPPVLSEGRIFVRNAEGQMVAVELKGQQ